MSASGVSLVVTGFGVFADVFDNPSMRIVEELSSNCFACEGFADSIQFKILEVSVDGCSSFHDSLQSSDNKEISTTTVFVHIGVNSKGTHINLEECAYNNMTFRVPDVKGFQPESATIFSECPLDQPLYSSLCLAQICQALNQTVPVLPGREDVNLVQLSQDPGRYLCNYVYYQALSHHKAQQKPMLSVFVHVPPFEVMPQNVQVDLVKQLLILIAKNAAEQI